MDSDLAWVKVLTKHFGMEPPSDCGTGKIRGLNPVRIPQQETVQRGLSGPAAH